MSGQVKAPSSAWVKSGSSLSGYFNKAAVSTPSYAQPFGNSSRNSLRGPAFHTLDLGLHKQFLLWSDTSNLEFRMESFNTLNEVNLTTPDPNFSSATFGTFTPASSLSAGAVLPARQVQFALRLQF